MIGRRRLLTRLSAVSVASALPSFTFGAHALAQDPPRIIARLESGDVGPLGQEYRLFLKSSRAQTLAQVFQVREAHVLYDGGDRQALNVTVASSHTFTRFERRRRAPPRLPPLTLDTDDVHVATLSVQVANPRNERGRAVIVMGLADQLFDLPAVTFMA